MEAVQTPLLDLLKSVPLDGRAIYKVSSFEDHSIPYGRLIHKAVANIADLERQLAEANTGQQTAYAALEAAHSKIAEVTRERDTAQREVWQEDELRNQLAAALAREQQLQEALKVAESQVAALGGTPDPSDPNCDRIQVEVQKQIREALATKPDDSALKAYVAKEQAKMLREMAHEGEWSPRMLLRKADELEAGE